MIPNDLPSRTIRLPETDEHSIILLTGTSLRHHRFAYRMQQEFGDMVLAWYQVADASDAVGLSNEKGGAIPLYRKALNRVLPPNRLAKLHEVAAEHGWWKTLAKCWSARAKVFDGLLTLYWLYKRRRRQAAAEVELFSAEIQRLKSSARLEPRIVSDPSSGDFIAGLQKLNAYFLLTLGGPLYSRALLQSVRGVAINQHAGWSPTLKGSFTIEWALYHRSLDHVGSTVHILTTGADAGPILRRSHPCLTDEDTPDTCFLRVVALGTELMIECVREIIARKDITVYESPHTAGRTYRNSDLAGDVLRSIYQDFAYGLLGRALARTRDF